MKLSTGTYLEVNYDSKEEMEIAMNTKELWEAAIIVDEENLEIWYDMGCGGRAMDAISCSSVDPRPEQLPPHIKMNLAISFIDEDAAGLLEIANNYETYFPGFQVDKYEIAQQRDNEAVMMLVMSNYDEEAFEEDDDEEEDEEDAGDIDYK